MLPCRAGLPSSCASQGLQFLSELYLFVHFSAVCSIKESFGQWRLHLILAPDKMWHPTGIGYAQHLPGAVLLLTPLMKNDQMAGYSRPGFRLGSLQGTLPVSFLPVYSA